ncbi:9642_t:CDS:2, partial [Funneliformis geosporum]
DRSMMNNVHIKNEDIIICNESDTKDFLRKVDGKQILVHNVRNALWKHPYFNVYTICIPDHMHHADLETALPNFSLSELQSFKNGFERLTRLTVVEYRDLMKIMLFVLNNLIPDKTLNKKLCDLYSLWIDMYIWSRRLGYIEDDLQEFEINL